jgi:hypothetical protein
VASGSPLTLLAGPTAFAHLRERGLCLEDVDVLVGAAGGTKFLVLGGLDRVLFRALHLRARPSPIHCVGASIGAWRMACLATDDPEAALDRLAEAYIAVERIDRADGGHVAASLLDAMLGPAEDKKLANHPTFRLHVLASRCRGLLRSDRLPWLVAGLAIAATSNLVSRRALARIASRTVWSSAGDAGPLAGLLDMATTYATLSGANVRSVLLASAAVPLLMRGVRVPGHRDVHRDAGIVDYHPVLRYAPARLVLYPHFYGHLSPGWFDRSRPSRRANGPALDRTVLLAPSDDFVARLPGGARPSRADAARLPYRERVFRWRETWRLGRVLGDRLEALLASPAEVAREVRLLS